jgi:hypothetical protein
MLLDLQPFRELTSCGSMFQNGQSLSQSPLPVVRSWSGLPTAQSLAFRNGAVQFLHQGIFYPPLPKASTTAR